MDFVVAPIALVTIRLFVGNFIVFSAKIRNAIRLVHLVVVAIVFFKVGLNNIKIVVKFHLTREMQ